MGKNNNKDKELDNLEHISEKMNNIRQSFSSEIETSIKNFESIPKKVTVRVEYVKCGKPSCNSCSENQYYHQYFH